MRRLAVLFRPSTEPEHTLDDADGMCGLCGAALEDEGVDFGACLCSLGVETWWWWCWSD